MPASPGEAVAASASAPQAHADHDPRYGGVVLMKGDLHFEVVLDRAGQYRVYFSDAARNELPAAVASDVTITVMRRNAAPEALALRIDDAGESWLGRGRSVRDDPDAVARIAYVFQGEPYWIDLPFTIPDPAALNPHTTPPRP